MAEKKKFLLRIDENVYAALEKWAADDLRSVNAQIEFLLSDCVRKANRNTTIGNSDKQALNTMEGLNDEQDNKED